jgi:transposase
LGRTLRSSARRHAKTTARRGHDCITPFVDIDQAQVPFATEGRDAATVARFAGALTAHGGDPEAVTEVCNDMGPVFVERTAESLLKATATFDKFQSGKIANDAVDEVLRTEWRQ